MFTLNASKMSALVKKIEWLQKHFQKWKVEESKKVNGKDLSTYYGDLAYELHKENEKLKRLVRRFRQGKVKT